MAGLFRAVLQMSAAAGAVGLVLLLFGALLRRQMPRWLFYALWTLLLGRMLLPALPALGCSAFGLFAHGGGAAPLRLFSLPPLDDHIWTVLGAIWLAGFLVLVLQSVVRYLLLLRALRGAEQIDAQDAGMPESVPLFRSSLLRTPVVCGFARPRIILPLGMDPSPTAEMRHVMSHELTHVLRRDNLWKGAATLALYLHWFNPLMWVCYRSYVADMETSCDERVVRMAKRDIRAEYASSLLTLAASRGKGAPCGGLLSFGEGSVGGRIKAIMRSRRGRSRETLLCAGIIALMALLLLTNPVPQVAPIKPSPAPPSTPSGDPPPESSSSVAPITLEEMLERDAPPEPVASVEESSSEPPESSSSSESPPSSSSSEAAEEEPVGESGLPAFTVRMRDIDYINLYPVSPDYSFRCVEDESDRVRLVALLGAIDAQAARVQEARQGVYGGRIEIRLLDGQKFEYTRRGGALSVDGALYRDPLLEELFALFEELSGKYPPRIEWLGYMNSYRIVQLDAAAPGEDGVTLRSVKSEVDRGAILTVAALLRRLGGVCRETVPRGQLLSTGDGQVLYSLRLTFDSGEVYRIELYDNAMLTLYASGMDAELRYEIDDLAGFDALSMELAGFIGERGDDTDETEDGGMEDETETDGPDGAAGALA